MRENRKIGMALIRHNEADIIMISESSCGKVHSIKTLSKGKATTVYKRKKE